MVIRVIFNDYHKKYYKKETELVVGHSTGKGCGWIKIF